jgi:osmoprotectant transport system substrate-binding protein
MKKFVAFFLLTFTLMLGIASCKFNTIGSGNRDIIVAAKGFTEQSILSELLAQQIEAKTNLKVERRNLTSSFVCHQAITSGEIDAYVEYTGTALTAILKQETISDPNEVFQLLKEAYSQQFNLEVMESLGFENTFALIIRGEDAQHYNIQTLSEAAKYTPQWRGGFGYEFMERKDGFPGLAKTYGFQFTKPPRIMDLGLIYRALLQKQVDIISGSSTDGQISRLNLVVLKDDRHYFPPYEATPIVRKETLEKYPKLRQAIAQLIGKISSDEMQRLNYLVEGELRDIKTVVSEFRKAKGLAA